MAWLARGQISVSTVKIGARRVEIHPTIKKFNPWWKNCPASAAGEDSDYSINLILFNPTIQVLLQDVRR